MYRGVQNSLSPPAGAVFRPAPNPAATLRLICFPYAGAGASAYHPWARLLPPAVELCALQLPGRELRRNERPYTTFAEAAAGLQATVAPLLDKPAVFFGHSLGALLAFETARGLRRAGQPQPRRLLLSSRRPPHLPEPFGPIAQLPEAEFVAEVQRRYDGIPQVILQEPELMALFLPTLRVDFAVLESHVYCEEPPLAAVITVYGGSDDPLVTPAALELWRQHTTGSFGREQFAGGHFYLQTQRGALLASIAKQLGLGA
jgi:medium-chain acyl-[acyl-carrier-protein] hydrolase